jgi:hypothetical protein
MSSQFRWLLIAMIVLAAVGWGGWWVFGRPPEDQVMAAQEKFLEAVADRDWEEVRDLLAADFKSNGGHSRDTAIEDAKDVFGQFFTLTIRMEEAEVELDPSLPDEAAVRSLVRVEGTGSAIAQLVTTRANNLQTPWLFSWRQEGRWPWTWRLVQVEHEELQGGRLRQ